MPGTDDLIAIDFADQAGALDGWRDIVRKTDVLLQIDLSLREREIVIDPVLKYDANERKTVKRGRADDVNPRCGREAHLHRDRIVALHLFSGEAGCLRGDLENNRGRIWIGLDVQSCERGETG